MSQLHGFLGLMALALALMAAGWSIGNALAGRPPGRLFVGNLVWVVIAVVAAGLSGAAIAIAERPPEDVLHVVYGLLAVALLPGAALIVARRPSGQQSTVLSIAGVVLAVLLFRLLETGG